MTLITAKEGDRLCRNWIQVGATVLDLVEELPKRGFAAFLPWMRFEESFCEGAEERELRRQCVVERAKERLGSPWPLLPDFKELVSFFRSPLLLELQHKRDQENGVPSKELSVKYPTEMIWRRESEPWARRRARASMERGAWYRAQEQTLEDEKNATVLAEIRASGRAHEPASELSDFDEDHRYRCFREVSKLVLAGYGFKPDARRSRPHYPVLSKELTDEWDICWVPGEHPTFAGMLDRGHFSPRIELRQRRFVTRISDVTTFRLNDNKDQGRFLFVRYQDIVPGFRWAYLQFTSLPILEHCIRAHLEIYKIIGPALEQGVLKWAAGSDDGSP
jgi:hypothetical protein